VAENSTIEWTDHTFNPWIGCTKVGPGCDNCYAADLSRARLGVPWGAGQPRRHTAASTWQQPRRWDRKCAAAGIRQRVFCASLADVFDNEVPAEWRAELFALIRETPNLDWLLVTKRIGNAEKMAAAAGGWPENVWLGATIVNQAEADRDIPKLLDASAKLKFLSMEPLLGPVDLTTVEWQIAGYRLYGALPVPTEPDDFRYWSHRGGGLGWIIVGGESGPNARPMHPDWARDLRDQCAGAGAPFLFKQWGEWEASLDRERDDPDWRADYTNDYVDGGKSKWLNLAGGCGFHGDRFHVMRRVGKKAAGRLLDGVQHDGVPLPPAPEVSRVG
jgi:protein gp37